MKFRFMLIPLLLAAQQQYTLGPDSQVKLGVPKGSVTKHSWNESRVFPGTNRDYWVYVPAQYDAARPACVMVFLDGGGFANATGAWRLPVVMDNLIAEGAMPVTIGVMVDPGVLPPARPDQMGRYNRSYEYDGLGDRLARFLLEEILAEVGKQYKLSNNPNDRAIAGSSSGGIAAFNVAWERPDAFRRVLSFIGSYTNLRGGDRLANLIRTTEPKPIRIFLQDGSNDQNIYSGSWWMANQAMAMSLEYAGYDVKFVAGTEGHNSRHGAAILPEALRWLWREYPKPVTAATKGGTRHAITEILDPEHDWEVAAEGYQQTEGPAVDRDGNVFFCDAGANRIYRIDATSGKVSLFKENTGGATGLMFGPDGRLYAAENTRKRVVAYSADGAKLTVLATGVTPNDLAVTSKGDLYFTDTPAQRVYFLPSGGKPRVVIEGKGQGNNLMMPNGVRVNPDESLVVVADTLARTAWSYHIEPDGSLTHGEPFYHLEVPDDVDSGPLRSGADGLTFDSIGWLYAATKTGIQVCDQPGRVNAIIRRPGDKDISNIVFAGAGLKTLYVTAGDKVYRRQLRRTGMFPWQPVKLPRPQL